MTLSHCCLLFGSSKSRFLSQFHLHIVLNSSAWTHIIRTEFQPRLSHRSSICPLSFRGPLLCRLTLPIILIHLLRDKGKLYPFSIYFRLIALQMQPKLPAWARIYEKWLFKLINMLSSLEELEGPFISDSELLEMGIEGLTLDFLTGEVPPTSTPYFTPSTREQFTVANSGVDPARDKFSFYRSTRSVLDGLSLAFDKYSFALFHKDNGYWGATYPHYTQIHPNTSTDFI
jgi:hypothetical protein